MTAGLLVMGLLKTPLRWSGALLLILGTIWAARLPAPDVLVAGDGRTFAVRGADGRLAFHTPAATRSPRRNGLRLMPMAATATTAAWARALPGCVGKLADGALVAYVAAPDAFKEDCRRALLVIAGRDTPPPGCAAPVISRRDWRERGALTLRRTILALSSMRRVRRI